MGSHPLVKEQIKPDDVIPQDTADKWERMTQIASERLFEKRKRIMAAVGTRPYQGLPVSEAELLSRYSQVRKDPQALLQILQENAKFKPDGRVLVPKALIESMKKMEKQIREGE
ncbi:hypothetical protein LCGC14_2491220 [marine sediment metagenome]|uniref:Uncharacterized protein n=1 Tax=marine sediment metagenome TaxID=412755 RepID=A0A0F9BSK3_9ZZZZ